MMVSSRARAELSDGACGLCPAPTFDEDPPAPARSPCASSGTEPPDPDGVFMPSSLACCRTLALAAAGVESFALWLPQFATHPPPGVTIAESVVHPVTSSVARRKCPYLS